MSLRQLLLTNPDQFMKMVSQKDNYYSQELAAELDNLDPLNYTARYFDIDGLIPMAGHSLGPAFKPTFEKIQATIMLQKKLHAGHFKNSHPEGKENGHWFDCDRHEPSLRAAQEILGFKELHEFNFTASGLSENLGMLMETFFRPTGHDWSINRTKIMMLETEFFSDRAIASSVMKRAIETAAKFVFSVADNKPDPEDEIFKIKPDKNGIYRTAQIISDIKMEAEQLQIICLPDIVFNTGQRLELDVILSSVKESIQKYNIKVILDLAHTVGNRPINLEALGVTAAVGCSYKHLCGYAGSGFGIYVNRQVDLSKFPPIQGWKAANPQRVFASIDHYDASLMDTQSGATAFRTSNPPPIALLPAQTYLITFAKIGFHKLFNKSECLTQYLIDQLYYYLKDKIEFITPLDSRQRGATISIRFKQNINLHTIEEMLKTRGFEIDTRPPNIMRITAHYGYNTFSHVHQFVQELKLVINSILYPNKKADSARLCQYKIGIAALSIVGIGLFCAKVFHNHHTSEPPPLQLK